MSYDGRSVDEVQKVNINLALPMDHGGDVQTVMEAGASEVVRSENLKGTHNLEEIAREVVVRDKASEPERSWIL